MGEDAVAVFLTWSATQHPYWAAAIAGFFGFMIIVLVRWVLRALLPRAEQQLVG